MSLAGKIDLLHQTGPSSHSCHGWHCWYGTLHNPAANQKPITNEIAAGTDE